jgi:hypothetical protein
MFPGGFYRADAEFSERLPISAAVKTLFGCFGEGSDPLSAPVPLT